MDELTDSVALTGDPDALRHRLIADGYLLFRGLLPADPVHAAARHVTDQLRQGGWVDDRGAPSADHPPLDPRHVLDDPAFRAALESPAFNRIPYLAELRQLIAALLGLGAFSYPAKALRFVYPERFLGATYQRFVHRDYAVSGVQDMLTTWIPLMDIPIRLGGLAIRPGSHLGPPQRPHTLDETEPGWATADYRAGDVLVFHCLTAHGALPNRDDVPRLSGDFRWQLPNQIAPTQLILDPASDHEELFRELFAREPWWQPVPAGLNLSPRGQLSSRPPGPSRFFPVHSAWRSWRPPGNPNFKPT